MISYVVSHVVKKLEENLQFTQQLFLICDGSDVNKSCKNCLIYLHTKFQDLKVNSSGSVSEVSIGFTLVTQMEKH